MAVYWPVRNVAVQWDLKHGLKGLPALSKNGDPAMTLLTKDAILKAKDIKTKRVYIEEWGGDVLIKNMTAQRHAIFEDLQKQQGDNEA